MSAAAAVVTAIVIAGAGGVTVVATAVSGTKLNVWECRKRRNLIPGAFFHDLMAQLDDAGFCSDASYVAELWLQPHLKLRSAGCLARTTSDGETGSNGVHRKM